MPHFHPVHTPIMRGSTMKSPFPGMDPYLEQYWREVHSSLVVYARDQLQSRLPGGLRVSVEERVFVESDEGRDRVVYPDVHVVESPKSETAGVATASATEVDVAEPVVIHTRDEPATETYLEIVEVGSGNRVITVIEFLSPSNKIAGEGQKLYLEKQQEVRDAGASLVEIDLTRRGERVVSLRPSRVPRRFRKTYLVCVRRGWKPLEAEIYPIAVSDRLPGIRIPLRQTDADVPLHLQPLIDQCYANGRYETTDYRADPDPPLDPEEAAWVAELLKAKGLR
jgi:hypothetical protein